MGNVARVLRVQAARDIQAGSLAITQGDYTRGVPAMYGVQDCRSLGTPRYGKVAVPGATGMQPEDSLLDEVAKRWFKAIVGSAMCLSHVTRYSMSYAVSQIVRAMSRPSNVHVGAAKHCVRYVAGTSGFRLNANSDVNCGNHPYNEKSTLSYVIMMCNGPVSLKACMHGLTAQSMMERNLWWEHWR